VRANVVLTLAKTAVDHSGTYALRLDAVPKRGRRVLEDIPDRTKSNPGWAATIDRSIPLYHGEYKRGVAKASR